MARTSTPGSGHGPQDPFHRTHGVELQVPIGRDPSHDDIAGLGLPLLPFRDQNIPKKPVVEGPDVPESPGLLERAHHRGVGPIQNLDDPAMGVLSPGLPFHSGHDPITVHAGIQKGSRAQRRPDYRRR